GSVEHRMDLLYQGVVTGQLTLERWVEATSTTPARMFGMYGRKGVIAPGADADVVVYDPNGHTPIAAATHHMNMDHSPWEGYEIDGHVDTVLSRGKVIVAAGRYLGSKGDGRFVKRGLSQYLVCPGPLLQHRRERPSPDRGGRAGAPAPHTPAPHPAAP